MVNDALILARRAQTAQSSARAETEETPRRFIKARTAAILVVGISTILVSLLVGGIIVYNARVSTSTELAAAFRLSETFIKERRALLRSGTDPMSAALDLAAEVDASRHVKARVVDTLGVRVGPARQQHTTAPANADPAPPGWFHRLIAGETLNTEFPIVRYPNTLGQLVLVSDPADEIAEVWADFRIILPTLIGAGAVSLWLSLTLVLALLRRLEGCTEALARIKQAEPGARAPRQRLSELAALREGINDLASHLEAERQENRRLQRRLMTLSESERKRIASDLHDGIGPGLFALRAALGEAQHHARSVEGAVGKRLKEALDGISRYAAAVQAQSRTIIANLRPMLAGSEPLADTLTDLSIGFADLAPGVEASFEPEGQLADSYGEAIDLSVYRFVQESVLNAVRHGGADRITIVMGELAEERLLRVRVCDNGNGPNSSHTPPNYGQLGIMDRIHALEGSYNRPERDETGGIVTEIRIPFS